MTRAASRTPGRDPSMIQSLTRGLQIVQDLIEHGAPVRLKDVAARHGIDKASAFRFLNTLQSFGMIRKDAQSKEYALGNRLYSWLALAPDRLPITEPARPHLRELARSAGQGAHLAVLSQDSALLVDFVPASAIVQVKNRIGVNEPLHCTAVGKAMLAFLPQHERDSILDRLPLERYTAATIVDRRSLERHLQRIRTEGVAVDRAEFNDLLYCIAAPVRSIDGTPLCSIGISLVAALIDRDAAAIARLKEAVKRAGQAFERQLRDSSTMGEPNGTGQRRPPGRAMTRASTAAKATRSSRSPRRTGSIES